MKTPKKTIQASPPGCRLCVDTSGYSYPEWVDAGFYPPGTPAREMLASYSRRFSVTELNYTWYQMPKAAIHLNVADFAVAVERLSDRQLTDKPVIIAPEGVVRATVYDMSEEAYQDGVRKGMLLRRARRLCPKARILAPHTARYEQAMTDLLRQALPSSSRSRAPTSAWSCPPGPMIAGCRRMKHCATPRMPATKNAIRHSPLPLGPSRWGGDHPPAHL